MDDGIGTGHQPLQRLRVGQVADHGFDLGQGEVAVRRDAPGQDADLPALGRQPAYQMRPMKPVAPVTATRLATSGPHAVAGRGGPYAPLR